MWIKRLLNRQSFEKPPIEYHLHLRVIDFHFKSQDRAKITTKRRKPTRQGRLAALENSDKEIKPEPEAPLTKPESEAPLAKSESPAKKPDLSILDDDSDSLFSSAKPPVTIEPPKMNHKTQEKKKMNLMSQLISEVATSKVAIKRAAVKEDEEDDDFDIFSVAAKKDRSKSSFSFQPPEENGIASMFPIDKKEDEKEDTNVSKSDSFEEDFFTEPAFQSNFVFFLQFLVTIIDLCIAYYYNLLNILYSNLLILLFCNLQFKKF